MQTLTISAVATDASSVARMTFQADGKEIRNFTGTDVGSGKAVTLDWQGAKSLAFGHPHDLRHRARPAGQHEREVRAGHPRQDAPGDAEDAHQAGQGQDRQGPQGIDLRPRAQDREPAGLSGKVRVYWQQKRKGKWKTIHGGLKPANKPFTFKQKLKSAGTWRVMVKYVNVAPYKASTALSKTLRVKH